MVPARVCVADNVLVLDSGAVMRHVSQRVSRQPHARENQSRGQQCPAVQRRERRFLVPVSHRNADVRMLRQQRPQASLR